jgi:hypothetical protein
LLREEAEDMALFGSRTPFAQLQKKRGDSQKWLPAILSLDLLLDPFTGPKD